MQHHTMMSDQAQKFIDDAPPLEHEPVDPATIDKLRADTRAGFEPAARRAVARHKVQTQDIEIAGIACMEVKPEGEQTERTVLYCYGGGYVTGSPFEDLPITAALADHLKARVVAIGYRLAPEHPYPAAVDDGFAVYQSVCRSCAP
ncbi:MAG: alpha/beta hydrolase fold domain-containing protein, partial [Hyphomicrobiales bacterium]|nr:alpha/beta hydrolase fold domain-containing protein [Hyphomicrobiales bacterium]